MNVGDIVQAVADALEQVEHLQPYPHPLTAVNVGEHDIAAVRVERVDYQLAFAGGLSKVTLLVELNVQASVDDAPYIRMCELLSGGAGETRSVIDALTAAHHVDRNPATAGPLAMLTVVGATRPRFERPEDPGGVRLLVAEVTVEVSAKRVA